MKKMIKKLTVALTIASMLIFSLSGVYSLYLPDSYRVTDLHNVISPPVAGVSIENISSVTAVPAASSSDSHQGTYNGRLMLGGVIPIKDVTLDLSEDIQVIPCGTPFGVKMFTQGVMVVKTDTVTVNGRTCCPAAEGGIEVGDVILKVNDDSIRSNEELIQIVSHANGEKISLDVMRDDKNLKLSITPVQTSPQGDYKIGLWVRDSSAGIGTVTFYQAESKTFGGLGHGICDVDTGALMSLSQGDIVQAKLDSITTGIKGTPGALNGHFDNDVAIGTLLSNCETGVYGYMEESPADNTPVEVASKHEVRTGSAKILTTISGDQAQYYDIEIESINYNQDTASKNMTIKITDETLLEKTGGIVQGMSGSPILQNGKLVGAVTHVFVNEPEKGYAIFSENMLADLVESTAKNRDIAA